MFRLPLKFGRRLIRNIGDLTLPLPGLQAIPLKYILLFWIPLACLITYGVPLAILGALLAYLPKYRCWLWQQPGYVYYLSKLWGLPRLTRPTPSRLALVTLTYLLIPSAPLAFWFWQSSSNPKIENLAIVALLGLPGLFTCYSWLTSGWGIEVHLDATSADNGLLEILKLVWFRLHILRMPWYFLLYLLIVSGLSTYGIPLAIVGAILAYNPNYRRWLELQPGYVHYLSQVPGLRGIKFPPNSSNTLPPTRLALVTLAYLLPLSVLLFGGRSISYWVLGLFGLGTFYLWLTRGWVMRSREIFLTESGEDGDRQVNSHVVPGQWRRRLFKPLKLAWNDWTPVRAIGKKLLLVPIFLGFFCYGTVLVFFGVILAYVPCYLRWLTGQLGYVYRLSHWPGWSRLTPNKLALVTFVYLFPALILSLPHWIALAVLVTNHSSIHLFEHIPELVAVLVFAVIGGFGIALAYNWLIAGWGVINDLNQKVSQLYQQGQYEKAFPLAIKVCKLGREYLGTAHLDYANSLKNLGLLYQAMGNYTEAAEHLQQALEIARKTLDEDDPDLTALLHSIAELNRKMGKYKEAEPLLRQALKVARAAFRRNRPDFARTLTSLALFYQEIGNYATSEEFLKQALEVTLRAWDVTHPEYATCLNNLAVLQAAAGKRDKAQACLQQALRIVFNVYGVVHLDYANILHNLGLLHQAKGNYIKAEDFLQEALKIRRQVLEEQHPDIGASFNDLGELYQASGKYTEAESCLQQALKIRHKIWGKHHPEVATTLNNLAIVSVAKGCIKEAMDLKLQAEKIYDQIVGQIFSLGSESQRLTYLKTLQDDLSIFLSLVTQYFPSSSEAVQTTLQLVLQRKAIGAEALAVQQHALLAGRYPTLVPKLQKLTNLRRQIAQKTLAGPDLEGFSAHQHLLKLWNAQKDKLEMELAQQIPEMDLVQSFARANWQAIANGLPEKTALVEFVRYNTFDFTAVPARGESVWQPARYLAFVLLAGMPEYVQMVDLGEAEPIDQTITMFRASITGDAIPTFDPPRHLELFRNFAPVTSIEPTLNTSYGSALKATILDPLLTALGGRRQLLLAPDGDLTRLPFEVLPIDSSRRLIDEYRISYLSTSRDVLRFQTASPSLATQPIVAADPDFELKFDEATSATEAPKPYERVSRDLERHTLYFNRLPGTRLEGEQIAAMLSIRPWQEGKVLEAQLKACHSPRLLHIATHGFFLPHQKREWNEVPLRFGKKGGTANSRVERLSGYGLENPLLRSGLALAGANTWLKSGSLPVEAEDGILTAEDVSGLDLLNTELVVLSACETGLGEIHTGEGVFGLRRAFVLAGTKTLVMSLWKVPDSQTQELMEEFYRLVLGGQPRADALRTAQLSIKENYPNPLYWGAFICQGAPGPLLPTKSPQTTLTE